MSQERIVSSATRLAPATLRIVRRVVRFERRERTAEERSSREEAERELRSQLATLLEGYPPSDLDDPLLSYQCSSASIRASVDSVLVRHNCFTTVAFERVQRMCGLLTNDDLIRYVESALAVERDGRVPRDVGALEFWRVALRLHLDSFLGLACPSGATRPRQLLNLLSTFHYQSVAWKRRAAYLARAMFGLDDRQQVECLLLGLALEKDPEVPAVDLRSLAQKARISVDLTWSEMVDDAVARWRQLSGGLTR